MAETDKDDLITIIEENEGDSPIPETMPLMPVRDVVIFTDMLLPLFVGREKSVQAVEAAVNQDGIIFLATQKEQGTENPKASEIYRLGTISRILRMLKLPDGRVKVLVQGIFKGRIQRYLRNKAYFKVKVEPIIESHPEEITLEVEALMRNVRELSEKILALRGELTADVGVILDGIEDPGKLADLVASNLKLKISEFQAILEAEAPVERLKMVNDLLIRELNLSSVQAKIQSDVKDEISKSQRDYFLREQMRAIHRELGENDEKLKEIEEYRQRIQKARLPREALKEAEKQLRRLEQMHAESAESTVVRTYLDWLTELPWSKESKDRLDIKAALKVLNSEHHGLEKIKDRILEHLSVRKLNPKMKGPILCFVGPPGVGKTSLGRAIAEAMGRKFIRISLGGIRDEAEIRGHRRTYIGALPGRILQGLKQCGTRNPVFMMDEIDKLGADFRGDPSSALLEALDPEQNSEFSDHYINLAFDLSKVMFILTANHTDTIPSALLDRMEVITLSGYTAKEKKLIAQRYLLPRQLETCGLKRQNVSIGDPAMGQIISEYTAEAGLRNLERELGKICRKVARHIAEGKKGPFRITRKNLESYLGVRQYYPEMDQEESQVGLATGLAWTQVGGEVLFVETSLMSGKGDLIVTGQLGEVMQESARAALSFVRAVAPEYGIDPQVLESRDIHIHVPAGAIPKDGPSAGIAMATALISVLSQRPVDNTVAMTGEITLRGRVLPIGGLKEKALGALRAGIRTVLFPEKNKKDLVEIPAYVKRRIQFIAVADMSTVLETALQAPLKPARPSKKSKAAPKKDPHPKKPKPNGAKG